jgi:hypothetical protein
MKHHRIWNLSDHPDTKVRAEALVVLGRTVRPGHSIVVTGVELEAADLKLRREAGALLIHVGDQPPDSYLLAKGLIKADGVPEGQRAHGQEETKGSKPNAPLPGGKKTAKGITLKK